MGNETIYISDNFHLMYYVFNKKYCLTILKFRNDLKFGYLSMWFRKKEHALDLIPKSDNRRLF